MGAIGMIGFGAVGLLVLLWLVISFSEASRRRAVLEWLAATCLYVALSMLFLNLTLKAREADHGFALVAFGFLGLFFGSGSVVSLVNTLRSLRPARGTQTSATN